MRGESRVGAGGAPSSPPKAPPAPLIVTAELPPDVLAWGDALRRAHYPPERNHLEAHVTLFHAFAPSLVPELKRYLAQLAGGHGRPAARLTGLMPLGRGTALAIDSPGMLAVRERIAEHFHGALTAQDSRPPRLHITIQNKVTREAARELQRELGANLEPRAFAFAGLGLHLYRGGPWEAAGRWSFRGSSAA
ncbi:MAG: 2'-5' RNA ligase family protein [Novosphingobium sp.]|nr:2'-5' RNA ligase family protein [Novosphingobium sp.]